MLANNRLLVHIIQGEKNMTFEDVQPIESVVDLLGQGWIILEKDGIMKRVRGVDYGSVEIRFKNGQPYLYTIHTDELIL